MNDLFSATALLGGVLIGLAVVLFALLNGRLLGVSGIVYGLIDREPGGMGWRVAFLGGLLAGGSILLLVHPRPSACRRTDRSWPPALPDSWSVSDLDSATVARAVTGSAV